MLKKDKYSNEINKICEILDEYCCFDELCDESFEWDIANPFDEHYTDSEVNFASGATKGVLIFPEFNFVIKIPFEVGNDGRLFYGAVDNEYEDQYWNYCEQEVIRYKKAKENGVEDLFLETEYLCCLGNSCHPIYIQELADCLDEIYESDDYNTYCKHSDEEKDYVNDINTSNDYFNSVYINKNWLADIFVYYGEEKYYKFAKYIKDNNIDDLRTTNVGYAKFRPIIFDYAGYND